MTRRTDLGRWFRRSLIAASLSLALVSLSAWAEGPTLNETGSTLLYPLFQRWIPDYTRLVPGITITAAATGSGTGIAAAISGDAHIGASDAYMSDEQAEQNTGIVNIPARHLRADGQLQRSGPERCRTETGWPDARQHL